MAKNAVDAHRKLLRKKEVAKNKQDRKKAREISVVKKDTRCESAAAWCAEEAIQLISDPLQRSRPTLGSFRGRRNKALSLRPTRRSWLRYAESSLALPRPRPSVSS